MARHCDIKKTLDFIRDGYSSDKSSFSFTVADIEKLTELPETKAKEVIQKINDRALFWKGRFQSNFDNFTVSDDVFERIKDLYK